MFKTLLVTSRRQDKYLSKRLHAIWYALAHLCLEMTGHGLRYCIPVDSNCPGLEIRQSMIMTYYGPIRTVNSPFPHCLDFH